MSPGAGFRGAPAGDRRLRGIVALFATLVLVVAASSLARAEAVRPAAPGVAGKEAPTAVTPSVRAHRVIAYYFHTTVRCASCRAIEAYAHEAIERGFADQLKDGRLVWKVVNVEVKGNEHFVKDYGLYTKSLVLVNEVRGKPTRWRNLEKVWQLLQDKDRFLRYVQDETRADLSERS